MRISLHEKLNTYIAQKGIVSHQEIKQLIEQGYFGRMYRLSNAERRLRHSESPMVRSIYEEGVVKRYEWIGQPIQQPKVRVMKVEGLGIKVNVIT